MPRWAHFERGVAVWLLCAAALPFAAAAAISLHRGSVTVRGSLPARLTDISIVAAGDITIRGARTAVIQYSITQKMSPTNGSAARALDAAMQRQAGMGSLTVPAPPGSVQTVRLEIPRGLARVTVISEAGNIDVADLDGSVITRNGAGRTVLDRIGGNASIRTAGGATSIGLIGGTLRCVSGGGPIQARTLRGDSVFESSGGEIYVAEALGAVEAYTGAGRIRIGHAGGTVTATTRGGAIEVGRADGLVIARNAGGPIQVASAPGVRCETASGAIRLAGVSGSVMASTTLGNIVASLLDVRHALANSWLETGEGDITVFIPSNLSVTLKATSRGNAGTIVSDFPVRLSSRGAVTTAEGRINGGGPVLQIAGNGGMIWIKRQ